MNTTMMLERAASKRSLERLRPSLPQPPRGTKNSEKRLQPTTDGTLDEIDLTDGLISTGNPL
jgi:hypothetical protein